MKRGLESLPGTVTEPLTDHRGRPQRRKRSHADDRCTTIASAWFSAPTRVFCCNHQGHDLEGSTGVCAFHAIAGDRHASCRAALSASIRSQYGVRAVSAHLLDEDVDGAATREPDRPAQLVADAVMQKSRRCITFEHDLSLENDRGFQAAPAYRAGRPSVAAHQQPRPRTRRAVSRWYEPRWRQPAEDRLLTTHPQSQGSRIALSILPFLTAHKALCLSDSSELLMRGCGLMPSRAVARGQPCRATASVCTRVGCPARARNSDHPTGETHLSPPVPAFGIGRAWSATGRRGSHTNKTNTVWPWRPDERLPPTRAGLPRLCRTSGACQRAPNRLAIASPAHWPRFGGCPCAASPTIATLPDTQPRVSTLTFVWWTAPFAPILSTISLRPGKAFDQRSLSIGTAEARLSDSGPMSATYVSVALHGVVNTRSLPDQCSTLHLIHPWETTDAALTAIAYRYMVPFD